MYVRFSSLGLSNVVIIIFWKVQGAIPSCAQIFWLWIQELLLLVLWGPYIAKDRT